MSLARRSRMSLTAVALLAACGAEELTEIIAPPRVPVLDAFAGAEWSQPINLTALNTRFNDRQAFLSRDELTIYLSSDRPDGLGSLDIWMSQRTSQESDWGVPVNMGEPINGPSPDFAPNLSADGHLLFFASGRPGGRGGIDVYMARRNDPNDEFGWSDPVNLGPPLNTVMSENAPFYVENAGEGMAQLYFNRADPATGNSDIYRIAIRRSGELVGSESLVAELSGPANDAAVSIRRDGREVWFWSTRAGSAGGFDLWVSARQSVHHPWGAPMNPGPPINTTAVEVTPHLSFDGRTLLFGSGRPGGLGAHDLWMATRVEGGR